MSKFDEAINLMKAKRKAVAEAIGTFLEAEAKTRVPVKTGDLRRKITHESKHDDTTSTVFIGTNVEYAAVVEEGSSPHKIKRNDGKPMRLKIDGHWVTVDEINHPGTKPQPYLKPSIEENIGELQDRIKKGMSV